LNPKHLTLFRKQEINLRMYGLMTEQLYSIRIFILIFLFLQGCASHTIHQPVPELMAKHATVIDAPDVRIIPHEFNEEFMTVMASNILQQQTNSGLLQDEQGNLIASNFLALSGGSEGGAFGAGFLNGWTANGTRPEFILVTGISTGALIAPFAFLGPDYDHVLKELYTNTPNEQLIRKNSIFTIFSRNSVFSTSPIKNIIAKIINKEFLDKIAYEHERGRRLFIGTTNMDTMRGVIWNMGVIAGSKHPYSLQLFRDIMLASISIPVAFPPVYIKVNVDGKEYDEMHVDGGTASQIFVYPIEFKLKKLSKKIDLDRERRLFIIRNSRVLPYARSFNPGLLTIAERSISMLITMQGNGDLYRIYLKAQRDELDFNLAFIPTQFVDETEKRFDPTDMKKLYDYAYQQAKKGYPWRKTLPGFE